MDIKYLRISLPVSAALLGVLVIAIWLALAPAGDVRMRVPVEPEAVASRPVELPVQQPNEGTLIAGPGKPADVEGSWPQFRGADRSNICRGVNRLVPSWPEDGPRVLWKLEVGEGHAGAAIHRGRVYLVDYDRDKQEDAIRCLSLADGVEIWRYTYSVRIKRNHGMSRTVPAVNDDYLVAIGPKCHVHCLNAETGQLVWKMDMVEQFGTVVPPWYTGQCPLIDGGNAILAPGGDPLMMAVELSSGRTVWKTPNPGGWGMTHSSITPVDFEGERQFVYCTTKGVIGVSAQDGKSMWTNTDWKIAIATAASPVDVGHGRIFLSGGYNSGCVMLRLTRQGSRIETQEVFRLNHTFFGADQHTPILYEAHIYGLVPPKGQLACLDLQGNRLWTSTAANAFGLGPFLLADGLLLVLNDQSGTLHLVEAAPTAYRELSRDKVLEGHDAFGPMAMASGRLILRDLTTMVCLKLPQRPAALSRQGSSLPGQVAAARPVCSPAVRTALLDTLAGSLR